MYLSGTNGVSYTLQVPWGDSDALKILERANWIGYGMVFPRSLYLRAVAEYGQYLGRLGVYVLAGNDEETQVPKLYVGQGLVKDRLAIHRATKEFWTKVYVFTSKDDSLNKAHLDYIESRLISLAKDSRRATCENDVTPLPKHLAGHDSTVADTFLGDLLEALPILGFDAFRVPTMSVLNRSAQLVLRGKGAEAFGADAADGFQVAEGSTAAPEVAPACPRATVLLRDNLLKLGVLERSGDGLRFVRSYSFTSPSLAAGVVLGYSVNGREAWADASGTTLKELQDQAASEVGA